MTEDAKPNQWAVLIGINGYHESLGELSFCVNDTKLLQETLVSQVCGFAQERVLLLTEDEPKERQPTLGNIHSWLATWLSRPGPEDLVLVYFAGHGREVEGQAMLAPIDATLDSLPVTGIAIQYVRDLLERCNTSQKVLILDACHSGSGRDVATMTSQFKTDLEAGKGIYTIASCDSDQVSYEWPEQNHGVFTYYLTESIKQTAAPDADGALTLDSVYDQTRRKVLEWCGDRRIKQDPVRICRMSGQIVIGKRQLSIEQQLEQARKQIVDLSGQIGAKEAEIRKLIEEKHGLEEQLVALSQVQNELRLKDNEISEAKRVQDELRDENTTLKTQIERIRGKMGNVQVVVYPPEVDVKYFLDGEQADNAISKGHISEGRHTLTVVPSSLRWGVRRRRLLVVPDGVCRKAIRLRKVLHIRTFVALGLLISYCVILGLVFRAVMGRSDWVFILLLCAPISALVCLLLLSVIKGIILSCVFDTIVGPGGEAEVWSLICTLGLGGISCGIWIASDKLIVGYQNWSVAFTHFVLLFPLVIGVFPTGCYRKRTL